MSSPNHPYAKSPPSKVATEDEDNVSMRKNSPSSKASESETSKPNSNDQDDDAQHAHRAEEEEIDFEESQFQIPPSFSRLITEETLRDSDTHMSSGPLFDSPFQKTR